MKHILFTSSRTPARVLPAMLVALSLVGCATTQGNSAFELDATRTALDAQMDETDRLESRLAVLPPAELVNPEPKAEMPSAAPPAPAPVIEPEPVAMVEETEVVAEPLSKSAEMEWLQRGPNGPPQQGYGMDSGMAVSMDRVARALEQQTLLQIVEARLADKQRLIDLMGGYGSPAAMALVGHDSDAVSALRTQQEKVAADLAARDAAAKKALDEKKLAEAKAAEDARWAAMMARLDKIESGKTAPDAAAAGAAGAAGAAVAGAPGATGPVDPKVAALEAQLAALKGESDTRAKQEEERKAADMAERTRQEELMRQASLEARLAQMQAQQEALLTSQGGNSRRDDRFMFRMFRRDRRSAEDGGARVTVEGGGSAAAPAQSSAGPVDPLLVEAAVRRAMADQAAADRRKSRLMYEDDIEEEEAAAEVAEVDGRMQEILDRLDAMQSSASPNQSAEVAALEAELVQLKDRASELESTRAELSTLRSKDADAKKQLEKLLQPVVASGLVVEVRAKDARIKLPSDVLFASGQFKLSTAGKDTVARVGRVLASSPGLQVEIEGHTDSQAIRGSTNWDLGFARARGVLEGLVGAGVPIERVKATSYGDTRPVSDNGTPEGRSANRRIELIVRLPEA